MYKKKILIDLDGVLNEYGGKAFDENYIPKIKEGAKEYIIRHANYKSTTISKNRKLLSNVTNLNKLDYNLTLC